MSEEHGKSDAGTEPQVSALAVWSLVCGTFFFLPPLGLLALILSFAARRRIRRSQGRLVGSRIANIGCGLGIISLAFTCFMLFVLPGLTHAREDSRVVSCRSNLKQIGLGIWMYEDDHKPNGRYEMPPDLRTLSQEGYVKCPEGEGVFLCPDASAWRGPHEPQPASDYAYARLIDPDSAPADAPIMWDKYLHTVRPFWHWRGSAIEAGTNVLKRNLSVSWTSMADLKASLTRNHDLYESIPPLPIVGGLPRGWSAVEYAAAAAVAFYTALILVALFRRRWIYALLPDRPRDPAETTPEVFTNKP